MLRGLRTVKWAAQWLAATGSPAWTRALVRHGVPPVYAVSVGLGGELLLTGGDVALPPAARDGDLLEAFDDLATLSRAGARYRATVPGGTLTIEGIDLLVRDAQNVRCAAEVFLRGSYAVQLPFVPVVVDVGMNVGMTSLYLAATLGGVVYGYEPFVDTFARAQENLRANPMLASRIRAHRVAVGGRARSERFVFCPQSPGDCGIVPIPTGYRRNRPVREERVEVVGIGDVLREVIAHEDPRGILLKIDCEGMEYEIVEALAVDRTQNLICAVMLEWHRRGGVGRPELLARRLVDMGFVVFGTPRTAGDVGMLYAARQLS